MSSLILNRYNHPFKFLISSSRSFLLRPSFMGLVIFGEDILSWILLLFLFLCWGLHIWSWLVGNEREPGADNLRTANLSSLRARGTIEV